MKHAIVIASLLALAGCGPEGAVTEKSWEGWERTAGSLYKHQDKDSGVVCYMLYPGTATSVTRTALTCIKE